jgi:hypothetical protein
LVKGYADGKGGSVIDDWMAEVPAAAQAKFDSRLSFMRARRHWEHHYAHGLKGCDGIWEVKFESGNIAYRPLFFMGPGQMELTFVRFAVEHNNRLTPSGVVGSAVQRMKEVIEHPERAIEYDG